MYVLHVSILPLKLPWRTHVSRLDAFLRDIERIDFKSDTLRKMCCHEALTLTRLPQRTEMAVAFILQRLCNFTLPTTGFKNCLWVNL